MSVARSIEGIRLELEAQRPGLPVTAEHIARMIWSAITEPGDRVAGELISEFGPVGAIEQAARVATGERTDEWRRVALSLTGEADEPRPAPFQAGQVRTPDAGESPELAAALERWLPRLDIDRCYRFAHAAATLGARLIAPGDDDWPSGLADLGPHGPHLLWARGDASLLNRPGVALIGSRAATAYGESVTAELVAGLAARGLSTISGGAYGIDGVAHRTALALDAPTVAVMAGGIDRLYPSGHRQLLGEIIARGVLVSELPCGASPTRWRFLQRNRIVAAVTSATVVVEAGARSGALNTAGHAASMGRPVGAVPGPITSAASVGCHRLIREYDAELITGPDDVIAMLGSTYDRYDLGNDAAPPEGEAAPRIVTESLDDDAKRVLDALHVRRGTEHDALAVKTGLAPGALARALAGLELDALAYRDRDGWRKTSATRTAA